MKNFLDIKNLANEIVERNGILFPPVPIEIIVDEEIGFSIAQASFQNNKISGCIDFDQQLILVNKLEIDQRQRFTIAHELGHFFLHHDKIKNNEEISIFYRKTSYIHENNSEEIEANYFAANILVPDCLFIEIKDRPLEVLAKIFKVSKSVIELRKIDYKG